MVVLDATVVNVALPAIQTDLKMGQTELQWIVNAYTLVFGGFLLLGGRAGDLIGRKRLFLAGVVVFTTASLLDGLSSSAHMLIVARGFQGLGAALVSPAALSIVTTTFAEGAERAKALGVWSAIAVGGGAVGLILGGVLTESFSWPWIFFVNLPVGVITFALSARYVPESTADYEHRRFDVAGAVTVTGGLVALVYAIVHAAGSGWTSAGTLGTGAGALVLLVAFVAIERRSIAPLVRLDIFTVPTLRAANVALLVIGGGLFSMFFFNSLYVQRVLGWSPLEAGLAFVPFTAGIIAGATFSQKVIARLGLRAPAVGGTVVAAAAVSLLLLLTPHSSYFALILPSILVTSFGMGVAFVPLTMLATTGIPHADAGLASGLFNTSQQIGGALGLAVLSTLAASRTGSRTGADALVDGFHVAYLAAMLLVLAGGLVLILLLRRRHLAAVPTGEAVTVPV